MKGRSAERWIGDVRDWWIGDVRESGGLVMLGMGLDGVGKGWWVAW